MLRLDILDVDLADGFVDIRKTKNKGARLVPIIWRAYAGMARVAVQNRRTGQGRLLVWEDGRPFTERNFHDAWHAACKRAGPAGFIPHNSCRSASRNMRNEGIPRPLRKKIIGHKTDSMDERYGIVDIEDAKAVREITSKKYGNTTAKINPDAGSG